MLIVLDQEPDPLGDGWRDLLLLRHSHCRKEFHWSAAQHDLLDHSHGVNETLVSPRGRGVDELLFHVEGLVVPCHDLRMDVEALPQSKLLFDSNQDDEHRSILNSNHKTLSLSP